MSKSNNKRIKADKFNRDRESREVGKVNLSQSQIKILIQMGLIKPNN